MQQPPYMRSWINVKHSFRDVTGHWPRGLFDMLAEVGVQPVGRAHSGIDDCCNMLSLMRALALKGHVFQVTDHCK